MIRPLAARVTEPGPWRGAGPSAAGTSWLVNAHAAFDRAAWPADDVPAEDVILSRLLALNGERADRDQ